MDTNQDMANNNPELASGFKLQVTLNIDRKARKAFSNSMPLDISSSSLLALALAVPQHQDKAFIPSLGPIPSGHPTTGTTIIKLVLGLSLAKEETRDPLA